MSSTSSTNSLNDQTTSVSTSGTVSGTKVITSNESGGAIDKQAFLKILAAELSNLDPTQDQDSSQYVTQMAQFASIEQMDNLNNTLTKSSYENLVGKGVTMTDADSSGNAYTGTVEAVSTDSSNNTTIYLKITASDGSTTTKSFSADDIASVIDSSESSTNAIATTSLNTSFLAASALTGQNVTVSTTDSNNNDVEVSGTIKSAYIENGEVMIKVVTSDGTTKEYPYSSVVKAGDSDSESATSTTST